MSYKIRSKARVVALVAATVLVGGTFGAAVSAPANANTAGLASAVKQPATQGRAALTPVPLYGTDLLLDQTSGGTNWGWNPRNQNQYAADHFTVPVGHTWDISTITAPGFFLYGNPGVITTHLNIYQARTTRDNDRPGKLIVSLSGQSHNYDANFEFTTPRSKLKLPAGNYWFSVFTEGDTNYAWYHLMRLPRIGSPLKDTYIGGNGTWFVHPELNDEKGYNLMVYITGTDVN